MTKNEIQKEFEKELKKIVNFHSERIKNMTQPEEWEYMKKNKVNEQIKELQEKYKKKYKDTK